MRLAAACSVFLMASCSVKEDRQECPCFLTLDFGEVETAALMQKGFHDLEVFLSGNDGFTVEESWPLSEFVGEYCIPVPKTGVDIMAVCHVGGSCSSTDGFRIDDGEECPAIYMYSEHFHPVGGEERIQVNLHRNYCNLSVRMKTMYDVPARPFRVKVVGKVDGYLLGGAPREGAFSYFSAPSSEGFCRCRIPRQKDGSLMLEIDFLDSGEVRTFPAGEYILASGYDWNAIDLEDILVEMDFSRTGVTFNISKWKKTLSFDITF